MECGLLKESLDGMISVLFIFDLGKKYAFSRGTEDGKSFVIAKP